MMQHKNFLHKQGLFFLLSVMIGAVLSFSLSSRPLEEQLINLSVEKNLSYAAELIDNQPIENKAILLDYADNQELVLKSWLALKKYPHIATQVFFLYGQQPEFQQALLQFGEGVVPVVDYFLRHDVTTLTVQATVANVWQSLKNTLTAGEKKVEGNTIPTLTPQQRGWYAIHYINQEGYNFLGQFALNQQGQAQWIQSDRTVKALVGFFTSGIRELEAKYKTDVAITKTDVFWAGVDVVALASTVKLLKASRAAAVGKELSYSEKALSLTKTTGAFSAQLIKSSTLRSLLKYTAIGTAAYIVIAHPSVMNTVLDKTAQLSGINPATFKLLVWTAIVFFLLHPVVWFCNVFVKPLVWISKKVVSN